MFQQNAGLSLVLSGALLLAFGSAALSKTAEVSEHPAPSVVVNFTTEAFKPGNPIPKKFSADGLDVSPQLSWGKLPAQAQSLAIVVDDPDAPGGTWVHWLVYDLPPNQRQLKESVSARELMALGAKQGTNSFGNTTYNGPAPPAGKLHHYYFKLYVLGAKLNLPAGASKNQLLEAVAKNLLAKNEFIGIYSR